MWVFWGFFFNALSAFQSAITATETHDNDFDGHFLKQLKLAVGQETFFALLKVLYVWQMHVSIFRSELERTPGAHLISPKTTWLLSSVTLRPCIKDVKDATGAVNRDVF